MWRPQRINYGLGWLLLIPDDGPTEDQGTAIFHFTNSSDRYECMIHILKGPGSEMSTAIVMGRRASGTAPWLGPHLQLPVDLATILHQAKAGNVD